MKIKELIQLAKEANSEQLGKLSDKKAAFLLRVVFAQIKEQMQTATDEPVFIAGFGQFRIKNVEKEQDGQKVTIRRIVFIPVKPKIAAEIE